MIQYYYKLILADDDEKLKIQDLILKLHKDAKVEVEAHEKAKRERAAVVAASQSITSEEMASMNALKKSRARGEGDPIHLDVQKEADKDDEVNLADKNAGMSG